MNRIIFILTLSAFLFSQQAEVANIQAAQRTDGSQIVDITYDLLPDPVFEYFEITVKVSLDGGSSYSIMQEVYGDLGDIVESGNGKSLTWNFGQQFGGTYSNQIKIKIEGLSFAIVDNNNNQELPFEMIEIPAGDYTYGEGDTIKTIGYDYVMMKYEVTDYDYVLFMLNKIDNYNSNIGDGCEDNEEWLGYYGEGSWVSCENISTWESYWYGCELVDDYVDGSGNITGGSITGYDACCICGGGTSNPSFYFSVGSNGASGYYPGDADYPAGEYTYINFNDSKITWNGEIFEVEEGFVSHPVTGVTWFGAWAFATHYGMELPDKYEWEKAARGNTGYDYSWGNTLTSENANYNSSCGVSLGYTTPTGYYNGQTYSSWVGIDECIDNDDILGMPCSNLWMFDCNYEFISDTTSINYFWDVCCVSCSDAFGCENNLQTIDSKSPYGLYDMTGNVSEWINDAPLFEISNKGGNYMLPDASQIEGSNNNSSEWTELKIWHGGNTNRSSSNQQSGFRCIRRINEN